MTYPRPSAFGPAADAPAVGERLKSLGAQTLDSVEGAL